MYRTGNVTSVLLETAKKYKLYVDNFLHKSALIKIWFKVNETFLSLVYVEFYDEFKVQPMLILSISSYSTITKRCTLKNKGFHEN